ncbi:hypothetical protein PTUN_b0272 [Pseudoalteromonas tunicata]|uniref:Flavohemoglobin expression-modulating QEGLA motif protein n=2 Tax=Pseudoalteromonas tunicata TaxID=314281 RepID=A4C398_9GAMM|nr:hypothetical protein PTUN_b0272 [Pseudoalteromonas tunicata]AXT32859.1 flavohemoglobin expression-modulating QEGLA motif protein [Pseudoalteromonas tunicata]EAR30030.1 hypothetical protein PTD2_00636 [Pseudoalteromonas tunicata D2]
MLILSEQDCIKLINQGQCFHASVADGAFTLKIDEYSPLVCAALASGQTLRDELSAISTLSQDERTALSSQYCDELLSSFPITLIANDSSLEYDLSQVKAHAIKVVDSSNQALWTKTWSSKQRAISLQKHDSFYLVLKALLAKLEQKFKHAMVFSLQSAPSEQQQNTFAIDISQLDQARFKNISQHFLRQLNLINLPNIEVNSAVGLIKHSHNYLTTHIYAHFDNTVALPLCVQKVFMNEANSELYHLVLDELKVGLKQAVSETAAFFMRRFSHSRKTRREDILSSAIAKEVIELDKKLYALCKNVGTLNFINPVNLASERKKFFAQKTAYTPQFKYKQLNINPHQFREQLYKLPVEEILDADIQQFYRRFIDHLATKIELLTSIGSDEFIYNSLKYYGEPDNNDIANAEFLLRAPAIANQEGPLEHDADAAVDYFQQRAKEWGLVCKVEKSAKLVAKAMVNNEKHILYINKDTLFSDQELNAFAHHELGIHMVTTLNAKKQPLKVMSLGLIGDTHTQEGLAILSEYSSGSLTLRRLQTLAMRVIAVKLMLTQRDFSQTFNTLQQRFILTDNDAFTLTTRVYRGGGFTKDYLYLKGFRDMLNLSDEQDLSVLLVGKTGISDITLLNEMVERGFLPKPESLFPLKIVQSNPPSIMDYLVSAIY